MRWSTNKLEGPFWKSFRLPSTTNLISLTIINHHYPPLLTRYVLFFELRFTTPPRSENLRRGVEALAPHRVEARRQAVQFAWKKYGDVMEIMVDNDG